MAIPNEFAYELASDNSNKSAAAAQKRYDIKVRSNVLLEGDKVLVRNMLERDGPGKLRSYWEEDVYVVCRRVNDDNPVYEVKKGKWDWSIENITQKPPDAVRQFT